MVTISKDPALIKDTSTKSIVEDFALIFTGDLTINFKIIAYPSSNKELLM